MALRLRVVSNHAKLLGDTSSRVFGVHGGTIGRSGESDWVLPDPERYISGKHARVDYRAGSYWLTDTSSNGTYLNDATDPVSALGPRELKDGDRLRMGDYDLLVSIDAANDFPPDKSAIVAYDGHGSSLARASTDNDIGASLNLDALLAPDEGRVSGIKPVNAYGQAIEPEKLKSVAKARVAAAARITDPPTAPVPAKRTSRTEEPPAKEVPWNLATRRIEPYRNPLRSGEGDAPTANGSAAAPATATRGEAGPGTDISAALQLLCRGAGIDLNSIPPAAQAQMLVLTGQILREIMFGMMDVLQVRTELRNRFRIAQTTIKPTDNNPLNFSAGVDEALRMLFEQRNTRYLGPVETIRDTFRDLKSHHQAVASAMEGAFGEFLGRLEPTELQERFDRGLKRGGLLSAANKTKYWELYKELFQSLGQNAQGDLPHVFVEDFARAYEAKLAEIHARGNRNGNGNGTTRDDRVPAAS